MMGVLLSNIFDSKVVHNEAESDGYPFVETYYRGDERLIVSFSIESFGWEIIGELSVLGKAIDTFPDFKIDPTVTCKVMEVVLVGESFRDFSEAYTCTFKMIERSYQVKKIRRR